MSGKIKCPYCGSNSIAKIQYGLPNFSESLQNDIDEGKITLGGCCEEIDDPDKHCNSCNKDFLSSSAKQKQYRAAEEYYLGEGKLNDLVNDYYERSGDKEKTVGTLLYAFGVTRAEQMLQRANGRLIRVEYGNNPDEIRKIHFIDKSKNKTTIKI